MKYEKPKLTALGSASESIQNNNIKGKGVLETHSPFDLTNGAYLADE
jgi:hypothetical protein